MPGRRRESVEHAGRSVTPIGGARHTGTPAIRQPVTLRALPSTRSAWPKHGDPVRTGDSAFGHRRCRADQVARGSARAAVDADRVRDIGGGRRRQQDSRRPAVRRATGAVIVSPRQAGCTQKPPPLPVSGRETAGSTPRSASKRRPMHPGLCRWLGDGPHHRRIVAKGRSRWLLRTAIASRAPMANSCTSARATMPSARVDCVVGTGRVHFPSQRQLEPLRCRCIPAEAHAE